VLAWEYPYAADTRLPSKVTATSLRETARQEEAAQQAEELPPEAADAKPKTKPLKLPAFLTQARGLTPAERGTALHLAMQYARPEACRTPTEAAAEVQRLREKRFLRPDQAEAVDPEKLSGWYASPLGRRVLAAEGVHREFKFSLLAPASLLDPAGTGEVLLQGVVDCWLEEPDGLVVIDYKTDRVTRSAERDRAAGYAPQLRAYAWALERITGNRVKAAYVYFFAVGDALAVDLGKEKES
jgi:ATP-dependent helicase/nuclease subunit A